MLIFFLSNSKFFYFGNSLVKWANVFSTNIKTYVIFSGSLSDSINIEHDCQQGN